MPRPPDYQGQMGRGGAAGPNAANPLIPKVIRAGAMGPVKTTTEHVTGQFDSGTLVFDYTSGSSLVSGEIILAPNRTGGHYMVTGTATLSGVDHGTYYATHPGWLTVTAGNGIGRSHVEGNGQDDFASASAGPIEPDFLQVFASWVPDDATGLSEWPTMTVHWRTWRLS